MLRPVVSWQLWRGKGRRRRDRHGLGTGSVPRNPSRASREERVPGEYRVVQMFYLFQEAAWPASLYDTRVHGQRPATQLYVSMSTAHSPQSIVLDP